MSDGFSRDTIAQQSELRHFLCLTRAQEPSDPDFLKYFYVPFPFVHPLYIVNTGVSTLRALKPAAEALAREHILLHYSDLNAIMEPVTRMVAKEAGGTHADEVETSMMLYIAPETVDMSKAVKDFSPDNPGPLTRNPNGKGVYSPTGIRGDPTLATQEKGRIVLVAGILKEIKETRGIPLPKLP